MSLLEYVLYTYLVSSVTDYYKWETDVFQNFDGNGTNYTLDSMENLMGFERASNLWWI